MKICLAPMEGVVNARMRTLLTAIGGVDRCVTEFVRVTRQLLPARVFLRYCPELAHGSKTPSGTPVFLQLLGSDPAVLADNAARAAELGAAGIDLNFGCPAKTVNQHRGGAVLLDEPDLIHRIVEQVRQSLPAMTPLTVKMRLGYERSDQVMILARAIASAGASELIIHARTKSQGYKPPAHWHRLAEVRQALNIPVIANGEIWSAADYRRCREQSLCRDVMLGRGLLAQPGLALCIKQPGRAAMPWAQVLTRLEDFQIDLIASCEPRHATGPLKQWLGYLRLQYPQAQQLFTQVKRLRQAEAVLDVLRAQMSTLPSSPTVPAVSGLSWQ